MKAIGSVEVPQEAFLSVLSMDDESSKIKHKQLKEFLSVVFLVNFVHKTS